VNILDADGGAGNDTIASGAGDDALAGNANTANGDTLDYSGATTGVNVNTAGGVATGMGSDTISGFENFVGSDFNDAFTGSGADEFFTPGAGDDTVNGGGAGADFDYIDCSDAPGPTGCAIDMVLGTMTGNGNDTFTDIEGAEGSDFADSFVDDNAADNDYIRLGGNDSFDEGTSETNDFDTYDGGGGRDVADYDARTADLTGDLVGGCSGGSGECDEWDNTENVRLGSGDDTWLGSAFNNVFFPGGGQNELSGGDGIDSVNYKYGYDAGQVINLSGGGQATGNDSITGVENAVGTAFNDTIIGTDLVAGTNGANGLKGGKGADAISGNAGPDYIVGGPGNDNIRAGSGDDTALGKDGNDHMTGGNGDDILKGGKGKDTCVGGPGSDLVKCEKAHKAKARAIAHARLARVARI